VFLEYLNQLNLKGDMVMEEFKRVSAEKDDFKKKCDAADKEIAELKEKVTALEAAKSTDGQAAASGNEASTAEPEKAQVATQTSPRPSDVKSPVQSVMGLFSPKQKPVEPSGAKDGDAEGSGEDFFSYDNEIPELQAEVASKNEEIEKLNVLVNDLKAELVTARDNSAGLVENLEKATRELSESRDSAAMADSLQSQVDARNIEIKTLTERIENLEAQLKGLRDQVQQEKAATATAIKDKDERLAETSALHSELESGLKKVTEAKAALDTRIVDLTTEIKTLRQSKLENEQKIEELNAQVQATQQAPPTPSTTAPSESLEVPAASPQPSSSNKKKNKKKKKGGAAGATAAAETTNNAGDTTPQPPASPLDGPSVSELQVEIASLKSDVEKKDEQIERLSKQRKTEEDLREEIETLRENILDIGDEHVQAKDKIKGLEAERKQLQDRIAELEKELEQSSSSAQTNGQLQGEFDTMRKEFEDLKTKSSTLQSDLGAAQQLAQSRYRDLTELREVLQKAQPELKSLRQEAATLKSTKEELAAKAAELRAMEKREKELKTEVSRAQRLATDRETETKTLREKLTAETNAKLTLENAQRISGRDLRKAETEKIELSAKEEKAARELQRLQEEMSKLRPRVKELEDECAKLRKEADIAKEDAELKTSQYTNAQNLLGSMRDQTHELSVQLKESQGQAESLEEEISECRKLLGERTREAETMRRLLGEADERANSKSREMHERIEEAEKERDRFEHEMLSSSRRANRQAEELKQRIKELEKQGKTLAEEKDELEHKEREWRRRREELEAVEAKADEEVNEMRRTVNDLRATLDASEQQVRDAEKARNELRRSLDDYRIRHDKLAKELKIVQGKLAAPGVNSPAAGSRGSMESQRSGGGNGAAAGAGGGGVDAVYLKTIMLQFLEQKDNKLRAQLVPVLGKLLRFDK
jgi:chromosome segregation ATPase